MVAADGVWMDAQTKLLSRLEDEVAPWRQPRRRRFNQRSPLSGPRTGGLGRPRPPPTPSHHTCSRIHPNHVRPTAERKGPAHTWIRGPSVGPALPLVTWRTRVEIGAHLTPCRPQCSTTTPMEDATARLRHRLSVLETQVMMWSERQARQEVLHESRINLQQEHVSVLIERTDHLEQGGSAQVLTALFERVRSLEQEVQLMHEMNRQGAKVLFEVLDTMQDLNRSEEQIETVVFDELFERFRELAARFLPH